MNDEIWQYMGMNKEDGEGDVPDVSYELRSAKEAADYLRISESTVWRWADQGIVPAYRVGRKKVRFKIRDLDALLTSRSRESESMKRVNLALTSIETTGRNGWDAMDRADALRERILARRGGVVLSDSAEDINTAREARAQDQ
ncbi:MAG TPA: helix-turn-helix domain-containing protein [Dehalococcoidia bacterium]|nr:helix-turn-helix domain-containing protein [Dehalococcoidia bacterium]